MNAKIMFMAVLFVIGCSKKQELVIIDVVKHEPTVTDLSGQWVSSIGYTVYSVDLCQEGEILVNPIFARWALTFVSSSVTRSVSLGSGVS